MFQTISSVLSRASKRHRPLLVSRRFCSKGEEKAVRILDELYMRVKAQKFEDIVVIKTKFNANPRFLILANAFSDRHLTNGTQVINKEFKNSIKTAEQEFAKLSISKDWNVLDFDAVILHLLSKDCRAHFDIDQLWAVGEKYDDLTNFEPVDIDKKFFTNVIHQK